MRFHVRRIQAQGMLESLARRWKVVLGRMELAEVVANLRRFRFQASCELEFDAGAVKLPDHHQDTTKNLVGFGILDVELQGMRE